MHDHNLYQSAQTLPLLQFSPNSSQAALHTGIGFVDICTKPSCKNDQEVHPSNKTPLSHPPHGCPLLKNQSIIDSATCTCICIDDSNLPLSQSNSYR